MVELTPVRSRVWEELATTALRRRVDSRAVPSRHGGMDDASEQRFYCGTLADPSPGDPIEPGPALVRT